MESQNRPKLDYLQKTQIYGIILLRRFLEGNLPY